MSPQEQQWVGDLFEQLSRLAPPEQEARMAELGGQTPENVLREVRELLSAHSRLQESDGHFLKPPTLNLAALMATGRPHAPLLGQQFGPYRLTKWIGRGAYGDVYQAIRRDHFEQVVAIKLVGERPGLSADIVWRFENERQILADLNHPNIAQLIDGGATADGRPYFVLEYISGDPVTTYCSRHRLSVRCRLTLFQEICSGVHHAHRLGVIHRDLKPENVLVTDDGVPKLVDFGIAKIIEPRPGRHRRATTIGSLHPMTLEYASPEQFQAGSVTPASDVYSLGVLLCELLTGRLPFEFDDMLPTQIEQALLHGPPPRPSELMRRGLRKRSAGGSRGIDGTGGGQPSLDGVSHLPCDVDAAGRMYAGDVDKIVLKTLRKEPELRYESAQALADDIGRYLDGRPVQAAGDTFAYRVRKYAQRHRRGLQIAVLVCLLATVGLAVVAQSRSAARRTAADARRTTYNLQLTRVNGMWRSDAAAARELLDNETLCPPDLRDFTWRYLRGLCQLDRVNVSAHLGGALCVRYSPDGAWIVSGGKDNVVRIWNADSGEPAGVCRGHTDWVSSVAVSPDGRLIASSSMDGTIRLWDFDGRSERKVLRGHSDAVNCVVFSPDGLHLGSASYDGTVRHWDARNGKELQRHSRHAGAVLSASFLTGADGRLNLVSGGRDETFCRWSLDSENAVEQTRWDQSAERNYIVSLRAASKSGLLAVAGFHRSVALWNADQAAIAGVFQTHETEGHENWMSSVCASPDGSRLASASRDRTIRIWNTEDGRTEFVLRGHASAVRDVDFRPDGRRLVSVDDEGTMKAWDMTREYPSHTFQDPATTSIVDVDASPDSATLAAAAEAGQIRLWDVKSRQLVGALDAGPRQVNAVAFSPDGELLATAGYDGLLRLWDWRATTVKSTLPGHRDRIRDVIFLRSSSRIVTAGRDRLIKVWSAETGRELSTLTGHGDKIISLAVTPDQETLVSASHDGTLRIWNLAAGRETGRLDFPAGLACAAVSPDGSMIAAGGAWHYRGQKLDPAVSVWHRGSLRQRFRLEGHTDEVFSIAYSPDGETIATGSRDHTVRLWDAHNGQPRAIIPAHDHWVRAVTFSPSGSHLTSGGHDGKVNLYQADWAATSRAGATPIRPTRPRRPADADARFRVRRLIAFDVPRFSANALDVAPDGQVFAAAGIDGCRLFEVASGKLTASFGDAPGVSVAFSPDGSLVALLDQKGTLTLRDAKTHRVVATSHERPGFDRLGFSAPARMLLASGLPGTKVWRTPTMQPVVELKLQGAAGFSADGEILAVGARNGDIVLFNTQNWQVTGRLGGHRDAVSCLKFSPDDSLLVSGSFDLDKPLIVWDVADRSPRAMISAHADFVSAVDFSSGGRLFASTAGGFDNAVRIWDAATLDLLAELPGTNDASGWVAFSPTEDLFLASGRADEMQVYRYELSPAAGAPRIHSNSRGQSSFSKRDNERSARTLPAVWQRAQ